MIYIGVDVGKNGGISVITDIPSLPKLSVYKWEDKEFIKICKAAYGLGDAFCVVEKVHSMPKQGVKSTFEFGKSAGFIEGVLQAYNIPYQLVPPQAWKKEFNLIGTDKKASIDCAKRLFPKVNLLATERSRVEHDGMAESLLLSEYARRIYKGE